MLDEEIRTKQGISYKIEMMLSMKNFLQQQILFNGNIFGNKCCRCHEGSLYRDMYLIVRWLYPYNPT